MTSVLRCCIPGVLGLYTSYKCIQRVQYKARIFTYLSYMFWLPQRSNNQAAQYHAKKLFLCFCFVIWSVHETDTY